MITNTYATQSYTEKALRRRANSCSNSTRKSSLLRKANALQSVMMTTKNLKNF